MSPVPRPLSPLLLCLLVAAPSSPSYPDPSLIGLWAGSVEMPLALAGPLAITRTGATFQATIGGLVSSSRLVGDSVIFDFGGDRGVARLRVSATTIRSAMWVQPPGIGPRYASPIRLRPDGPGRWRGEVSPLRERFTLYLKIDQAPDSGLRAVFRNPEANWTGRGAWFRVQRDRDTLRFNDPNTGHTRWSQPFDSVERRIVFDFGQSLELRPVAVESTGFLPRRTTNLTLARPRQVVGDWPVAAPAALGFDPRALTEVVRGIAATDPAAARSPRIHALLVARRGRLMVEEYFHDFGPDTLHDLRSASKTFTSVLAGIAMDRGAPFTMAAAALPFMGLAADSLDADPRRRSLTVGHLLSHASGWACDDNDDQSPGNEDRMQAQRGQPDWFQFAMALPIRAAPGSTYSYCSAGINLAGGVVAKATGAWLPALFDETVAQPLGFGRYAVNLMPTGQAYSGGGMYLRPRDFLKVGQVYLDRGRWRGRRVVSEQWVKSSTAFRIAAPNESSDGYGWHRYQIEVGGRTYQEIEASGNGGQFLVLIPELQLAIVSTAGNYGEYPVWKRFREEIVPKVIAAVRPRGR